MTSLQWVSSIIKFDLKAITTNLELDPVPLPQPIPSPAPEPDLVPELDPVPASSNNRALLVEYLLTCELVQTRL